MKMNNVTLGKVLKAMYKLSGKTLTQLSDDTDLTVDTINNLFYARVQKPGLAGVNALVNAMGFSIQQLMNFLEQNPDISDGCDVTEVFTKYITDAGDTVSPAAPAKEPVKHTKSGLSEEIELLNAEHEKQLDRFRAANQRHMDQMQEQHNRQIEQMELHKKQMEQHFDRSVKEIKEIHKQEIDQMEKEDLRIRKSNRLLTIAVSIETGCILLVIILDVINRSIGWLR